MISQQWKSKCCKMYSNLMCSAGDRLNLYQSIIFKIGQHFIVRERIAAVCSFRGVREMMHFVANGWMAANEKIDGAGFWWMSKDNGQISFMNFSLLEHFSQGCMCLVGRRDDHES